MLKVTITVDAAGVLSGLDRLSAQVPYALAQGINNTLKGAQADIRATLPGHFTLRHRPFIERTIKIVQFAKKGNQVGILAVDPTRDFLAKFEEDTTKTSLTGKSLAVPLIGGARPQPTSVIPTRFQIKNLKLRAVRTASGKVMLKGELGTFVLKGATNTLILQRLGSGKNSRVKVLYVFKRSVPITPDLGFIATATKGIDARWPFEMAAAFDAAVATAR